MRHGGAWSVAESKSSEWPDTLLPFIFLLCFSAGEVSIRITLPPAPVVSDCLLQPVFLVYAVWRSERSFVFCFSDFGVFQVGSE